MDWTQATPYNTGYSVYYAWGGALTPDTGAAFAGVNPTLGNLFLNYPMGRSVYNGLQSEYRSKSEQSISRRS